MKLLVDMNLSPDWVQPLENAGWETRHWNTLGDPQATDATVFLFSAQNGWVIFTHDLDFGAILAHTRAGETQRVPGPRTRCFSRCFGAARYPNLATIY